MEVIFDVFKYLLRKPILDTLKIEEVRQIIPAKVVHAHPIVIC